GVRDQRGGPSRRAPAINPYPVQQESRPPQPSISAQRGGRTSGIGTRRSGTGRRAAPGLHLGVELLRSIEEAPGGGPLPSAGRPSNQRGSATCSGRPTPTPRRRTSGGRTGPASERP